jgi:pimeloyl-ACP methyl ester carboxylesterase
VSALVRIDAAGHVPALIVWGEHDRIVPVRQGHRVHEQIEHTELAIFGKAGHFPHRDDPSRFVRVLDDFVTRAAAQRNRTAAHRNRAAASA